MDSVAPSRYYSQNKGSLVPLCLLSKHQAIGLIVTFKEMLIKPTTIFYPDIIAIQRRFVAPYNSMENNLIYFTMALPGRSLEDDRKSE